MRLGFLFLLALSFRPDPEGTTGVLVGAQAQRPVLSADVVATVRPSLQLAHRPAQLLWGTLSAALSDLCSNSSLVNRTVAVYVEPELRSSYVPQESGFDWKPCPFDRLIIQGQGAGGHPAGFSTAAGLALPADVASTSVSELRLASFRVPSEAFLIESLGNFELRDLLIQGCTRAASQSQAGGCFGVRAVADVVISGVAVSGAEILGGGNGGFAFLRSSGGSIRLHDFHCHDCQTPGSPGRGGSVELQGAVVAMTSSIFENCFSNGRGGAVYVNPLAENDPVAISVDNCTFQHNRANGDGGAIIIYRACEPGSAHFHNTVFFNNTLTDTDATGTLTLSHADERYCLKPITLEITDSHFELNEAGYSGAIYNAGTINASNTQFLNNSARNGGVFYVGGSWRGFSSYGDGVYCTDCTFVGNSASASGAVVWANFYDTSTSLPPGFVAGSSLLPYPVRFERCNFTENHGYNSGVLSLRKIQAVELEDCLIQRNRADNDDVISVGENAAAHFLRVRFVENDAPAGSSAINCFQSGSAVDISCIEFESNSLPEIGGCSSQCRFSGDSICQGGSCTQRDSCGLCVTSTNQTNLCLDACGVCKGGNLTCATSSTGASGMVSTGSSVPTLSGISTSNGGTARATTSRQDSASEINRDQFPIWAIIVAVAVLICCIIFGAAAMIVFRQNRTSGKGSTESTLQTSESDILELNLGTTAEAEDFYNTVGAVEDLVEEHSSNSYQGLPPKNRRGSSSPNYQNVPPRDNDEDYQNIGNIGIGADGVSPNYQNIPREG